MVSRERAAEIETVVSLVVYRCDFLIFIFGEADMDRIAILTTLRHDVVRCA